MRTNIRKEKGFTTIDVSIALLVIVVFVSIMSSILFSVYSSSTEAKRNAVALNYAVDIFERIGAVSYGQVDEGEILRSLPTINVTGLQTTADGTIAKIGTYDIKLKITDPYNDDKIKLVTLTITYPVSAKKTEVLELQRIKADTN